MTSTVPVRVFILFVVWSFLLFGLFGCFCFFAVWAGAWALPKQQKKTRPRPNSKKNKRAPAPSDRTLSCCLGGWACLCFLLFGRGSCFFLLFGRGACMFFLLFDSLTGLPGSSLREPTTEKTKQQKTKKKKKNTGSLPSLVQTLASASVSDAGGDLEAFDGSPGSESLGSR